MIEQQKESAGWEFLFIGANIDAVETASRCGIGSDRAVNYHADSKGTTVLYDTICNTICGMRASESIAPDWSADIENDYIKRHKKNKN